MNTSDLSVNIDIRFDEVLLKLRESLSKECFEIISENEMSDIPDDRFADRYLRVLCNCNSKISAELLKDEKAVFVPSTSFLVHEIDKNITEVTAIDPTIAMTPLQAERMGQVVTKLREMVRNIIRNL